MIKVNLLKDHSIPVEKKQSVISAPKASLVGYLYTAVIVVAIVVFVYTWFSSGNAIEVADAENRRLESELKEMEALRNQFVELEQKKQERLNKIAIIEKLLESQTGPVELLNAVIQAVPQNRDIWLTLLEQTKSGIKVKGTTRVPEVLPDFMKDLEKSGIFASVDVEQIERHDDISDFTLLCASKK